MKKQKQPTGFTIVELLIVIVVIGILAAITIVAFNGVQDKAKRSAAQQLVSQANKKVLAYAAQNSDMYPPDLAAADINNTTGLQYSYNNTSSPKTYGITATSSNFSYYISNTATQPTSGGYIGHGVNGSAAITNLAINPSFESNATSISAYYGTGGVGTAIRVTPGGQSGSGFLRLNWTTPPTSMTSSGLWLSTNASTPNSTGKSYMASGYIRNSWAGAGFTLNPVYYNSANTVLGEMYSNAVTIPANTWTRLSVAIPSVPAGTDYITIRIRANNGTLPSTGSNFDVDAFMLTEDSNTLQNYADGNSSNWIWNGATNSSTSTGSPQ